MKWITRKNIKVDRVACPWLIRPFIDPAAEFLFVDEDQLLPSSVPQRHSFGAGSLNELSVDEEIKMQAVLESEFTLRFGTWDNKRAAPGAALRAL